MYGETNKGPDQMKEFINKVAAWGQVQILWLMILVKEKSS